MSILTTAALSFARVRRGYARLRDAVAHVLSPLPDHGVAPTVRRDPRREALARLTRSTVRQAVRMRPTARAAVLATTALTATAAITPAAAFRIEEAGLTVQVTPTISSDYVFRGISQTRNRPAVQGTLDVEHASGLYVAAFVSNVAFPGTDARQELDVLAGYRFTAAGIRFDVGGIAYLYPGYNRQPGQFDLNYFEVAARGSYELDPAKVFASAFYSPNFQAESRSSLYVEGGVDLKIPFGFVLGGRAGYQWIERNERFGTPDYLNWSVTLAREVAHGFTLSVGYYDTDIRRAECAGGQRICGPRAMVTLSRTF